MLPPSSSLRNCKNLEHVSRVKYLRPCAGASEDSYTMSTTPKAGSKASTSEVRASSRNPSTIGRGAAAVSRELSSSFLCNGQWISCSECPHVYPVSSLQLI